MFLLVVWFLRYPWPFTGVVLDRSNSSWLRCPDRSNLQNRPFWWIAFCDYSDGASSRQLHANGLQKGALEDGLQIDSVKKLAGIGASGVYSGNCRRDLLRGFCSDMKLAKPMQIEVPVLSKLKALLPKEVSLFCPTLMVESIYQSYPLLFQHMFLGMTPLSFWEQVSPNDPKLLGLLPHLENRQVARESNTCCHPWRWGSFHES